MVSELLSDANTHLLCLCASVDLLLSWVFEMITLNPVKPLTLGKIGSLPRGHGMEGGTTQGYSHVFPTFMSYQRLNPVVKGTDLASVGILVPPYPGW